MGNFDGLHRGHAVLIGEARELARAKGRPAAVLTFEPHPRSVFFPGAEPFRLTPFRVKERERTDTTYVAELRKHNELNRRVFQRVAAEALAGRGVAIGFTDNYRMSESGEPICALKSYVLSPFANEEQMHAVVDHVLAACAAEQR